MQTKIYPPVPPTPKEYWEDNDWANEHISEISEAHPNLWVAVVGKKVVAFGKVIAEVRETAQKETGRINFPVIFAEKGFHVYSHKSLFSNQN